MNQHYRESVFRRIPLFAWIFLISILVLAGCSTGTEHPILTRESAVSRENAIVVIGVDWVEKYNDPKQQKLNEDAMEAAAEGKTDKPVEKGKVVKILKSESLLENKLLVKKHLKKGSDSELSKPLHYISNIILDFDANGEAHNQIVRYARDLNGYESVSLHQFQPGTISLKTIIFTFLKEGGKISDSDFMRKRTSFRTNGDFGTWQLESGKIVYLGQVTLYFKTKHYLFGFFTPIDVIEDAKLVKVTVTDRFDDTIRQLKAEKPWFPANEIVNQAKPGEWQTGELNLGVVEKEAPDQADPKAKRDKDKFFF